MVRVNFDKCPNLRQIKVGSKRTVGFSLDVLQRVSCGSLCIEIVEQHKKNIQLPPQFIVQTDFAKEDVAEYLNSGLFDVSWYSSEDSSEVENILSLDEREIHTFKMTNEVAFADQLGSDIDFLLESSTLSQVRQLNLSDCKMTYVPAFYHMGRLTHVDLSNNRLGNNLEQLQEILDRSNSFPFLSRLNLNRNDLKALPNCSNMPSLNFLDISNNDILSLATLESKCLSHMLVNGNPLDVLDFDPQKLPSLIKITFGSEKSRFVHFKIVEKASEGKINLRITSQGEQYLMFPRPQVLGSQEKLHELCQCEEISPPLFNTSDIEEQMKCVSRLMDDGTFKHQSLDFSGVSLFSLTVGPEKLNNWLSQLTNLTHLTLSSCELQEMPDVTELILLQLLDVRHNKITKFKTYPNKRLANVDITENPILGFDFDENSLFGLRYLKLGSERTKYISLQVLQTLRNGLLKIDVSKENLKHLLYPPADCMTDKERLIEITDKASLDLTQIATHERKSTLEWMLCHSGSMVKTLNLSRTSEVDGLDYENIMEVFEENIDACYNLFSLTAKNLGIRQFPDVAPLSKLHRIDLGDNEIDTFTISNVPIESVCELDVSMNPIVQFNAKLCDLKKLQKLRIGSPKLKYICHPLLQKAASGLELFVHETSSQSLRYPPYSIVQNVHELRDFVKKRELSLKHLGEIEKRDTINWLFGTQVTEVDFLCLNFAHEGTFCSSMGMEKLNRLLSNMSSLTELNLSNCKLQGFPDITQLVNLKVLNVKNNSIVSLEEFSNKTLAEIDLSGNPILGYNFDKTALPALQCLTIGSTRTKYLSLQVLKMVTEKLLKLNVDKKGLKHLIYPPEQCFTQKNQLDEFVKTASFDTKLINENERVSALKWVLSHSNLMLRSLSISYSQKTDVSDDSEEVKEFLAIFKEQLGNLGNLQQLTMNCLGLRQMHNLSALSKLIKVDYSHNKITTIYMANLPIQSLCELDVSMNPIVAFNAEWCGLEQLQILRIGSPESRYVCFPLLHKAVSGLELSVHESSSQSLLFPRYTVVECQDKLCKFVRERTVSLQDIDKDRRHEMIDWLFSECNVDFKSFDLSGGNELDISKLFIPSKTIENVTKLFLTKCQLKSVPHLTFLKELLFVDISDNKISILEQEHLPSSLKELRIAGNPIKYVVIDSNKLSKLSILHCGSHKTEYISSRLVERVYHNDLEIYVPLEYEEYLNMPPSIVFSDREQLSDYVEFPERFLGAKADVTERLSALRWLAQDSRSSLNLHSQIWLSDTDLNSVSFKNIQTLTLSHCNLQLMPNLKDMSQLEFLDLSSNRFATICFEEVMSSLNTFNLSGNPINTIAFSDSVIPNLRLITIGSPRTRFISREVLKKVSQKTLILKVVTECRQYLWGPDWKTIANGEAAIFEYLNSGRLDVSHLTDLEQKKETLKHELGQNIHFTEFYLSKEKLFCEYLRPEDLSLFFHSLKYVKYLFLSDCRLNSIPNWRTMSSLHYADLSGNNLKELPPNDTIEQLNLQRNKFFRLSFRQFPKLTQVDLSSNFIESLHTDAPIEFLHTLNISHNPVPDINFEVETFPNIQSITLGSSKTLYISDIVLSQFVHQKLDIQVSKAHRECLVMPNWTTINKGVESVTEYLASTTLSVSCMSDCEQWWKAMQWLLNENKRSITNLDMSHQEDVTSYIGMNGLEFLFKHYSLKFVASINLSDCRLESLPDWGELRYLKNADVSGNELVKIPRSGILENLNISRNNIRSLSLSEADFPILSHVTVGSEDLQFIQFDTMIRIVDGGHFEFSVAKEFRNQLIFPPLFRDNFDPSEYIKEPEKYLHITEISKRRQATDWLLSEADFTFSQLDLSGQSELFGFYT